MASSEALTLLRQAQNDAQGPGSYRLIQVTKSKSGTDTTTTTTLRTRTASGQVFTRQEVTKTTEAHPGPTVMRVSLTNEEGNWRIFTHRAVLIPRRGTNPMLKFQEVMSRAMNQPENSKELPVPPEADEETRQIFRLAEQVARHTQFSGERVVENGHPQVRVTQSLDAEGLRNFRALTDSILNKLKKQLPLGKRILANTLLAVMDPSDSIPVQRVFVIDPATTRLVSTESFTEVGKIVSQARPNPEERIADLPPETVTVPADREVFHPKTTDEANALIKKFDAEGQSPKKAG